MATLADVFAPDAFSLVSMTNAISKIPASPTTIGDLGVFEDVPVAQTVVAVEENQGILNLIPTTSRGGGGSKTKAEKRVITPMRVPHIQADDTVSADDVLNVRAFGSDNEQAVADVVAQKLSVMRRNIDVTTEYLRLGAVHGVVTYPTGSVDANVDLFNTFGTSEQTVDFDTADADTNIVEEKCAAVRDAVESALGGTPYTGIYALCGRTFFRTLISHPQVKDLYLQQQALLGAQQGVVDFARPNRQRVSFGGIVFEEYYGVVSGVTFINASQARFMPVGVPGLFQSIYAPADLPETVGTLGQYMYARQYMAVDGKMIHLEAQSNGLHICTRPRCLVKGVLAS
jgi:hypothetical protein